MKQCSSCQKYAWTEATQCPYCGGLLVTEAPQPVAQSTQESLLIKSGSFEIIWGDEPKPTAPKPVEFKKQYEANQYKAEHTTQPVPSVTVKPQQYQHPSDKYLPSEVQSRVPSGWRNYGKSDAASQWELNSSLNITEEVAKHYVLTALRIANTIQHDEIELEYKMHASMLAEQFSSYINAASGGEMRHLHRQANGNKVLTSYIKNTAQSRYPSWTLWKAYYEAYGLEAVEALSYGFGLKWQGGYGGKKWKSCVDVLLAYLQWKAGKTDSLFNETMFVDSAIALAHNGNIVYDKLWTFNRATLMKVFALGFSGEITRMVELVPVNGKVKAWYERYKTILVEL